MISMKPQICIAGKDPRLAWASRVFVSHGYPVSVYGNSETEDSDCLSHAGALVLPMPATDRNGRVTLSNQRTVDLSELLLRIPADAVVFGGSLPPMLQDDHRFVDYGKAETVAIANAVPTAEGAIQRAMELLPITLWTSRCLVIGYGRIGRILAHRLQGLGADVTVCARKPKDIAYIQAFGYTGDITGLYQRDLSQYDCIFNTVPAPVLSEAQIRRTRADCLFIDLASAPGGIDGVACSALSRPYLHALSLPGQVAPATSGKIIADFILEQL